MKKFKFLYIAAAALLFAACANEEDGIGNNGPVAATVQADISKTVTRATIGNTWTLNDAIGVYAVSDGITNVDNKKYVVTDVKGTFDAADDQNIIYFKDPKNVTFSAYYPYSATLADGKMNWKMAEVVENEPCTADVLFASGATASKSSPVVKFEQKGDADNRFKHCMSLVKFVIKPGAGIDDNYLEGIYLKNIYQEGLFDTKKGTIEPTFKRYNYFHPFKENFTENKSFEIVMLPQSLEGNQLEIELDLTDNESLVTNRYKTTLYPSTDCEFKGGYKYTYNITVKNTGITIENANIIPWENGDSSDLDADIDL